MPEQVIIEHFSPHLFWDFDKKNIDLIKNKKFIIQRTLEYGLIKDWFLINKKYGIVEIAKVATQLSHIDEKTVSFISYVANISKEQFKCYTSRSSNPKYWNF